MTADLELWLYGSRARGDADGMSDTDVLAVGDWGAETHLAVNDLNYPRISISSYTWNEVEAMRDYGSLYLHHLALEGRRLRASTSTPDRLPALLAGLPSFSRARQDLEGFNRAFSEGLASLAEGGWPDFECSVIATIARHAAILGAYCAGSPAFGRERPFGICGRTMGYSSGDVAALLGPATAWRKYRPGPHQGKAAMNVWLNRVSRFLGDLQEVIDDYHAGALPRAA